MLYIYGDNRGWFENNRWIPETPYLDFQSWKSRLDPTTFAMLSQMTGDCVPDDFVPRLIRDEFKRHLESKRVQ